MDTRCDIGYRDKTWCHSHSLARLAAISTAVLVGMGVAACKEAWEGFVYPDRGDLTRHVAIGSFESLEACRAAAHRTLALIRH